MKILAWSILFVTLIPICFTYLDIIEKLNEREEWENAIFLINGKLWCAIFIPFLSGK